MPERVAGPTAEFLPDLPDRDSPGIIRADNVLPHVKGYKPARGLVPSSAVLDKWCVGAFVTRDFDGIVHNYAGDAGDLYELASGLYGLVSRGGGPDEYTMPIPRRWQFVKFNNNVIAANGVDPIQVQTSFSGNFADIVPTPSAAYPVPDPAPPAQYVAEIRGFLMTGWQNSSQSLLQWSALGDHTIWDATRQQAGQQVLQTGGRVNGLVGGEYGVAFCESAIYRLNYIGDPDIVFQIDEVAPGRGTTATGSIAQYGEMIYYIDTDGFYVFDGSVARPIGSNKLNKTFLEDYDTEFANRVVSAIDIKQGHVYWAYPSVDARDGKPDKIYVYDIHTGKFAGPLFIELEEMMYAAVDTSALLDDFISTNPRFATWDTLTPPDLDMDNGEVLNYGLDDEQFKGGDPLMSAFDYQHTLSTFTGAVLKACIQSAEVNFLQGGRALVTGFRALVDGVSPNTTVRIGYRDKTSGAVSWTSELTPNNETELADALIDARYHRFEINVDGDFEFIFGGEPEFENAGYV